MERMRLIRIALRRRCRDEGNWWLRWYEAWWFTAKCVVCLLFDIESPSMYTSDYITVANYDGYKTHSMEFGSGAEWSTLLVKKNGLGYAISSDGYP